MAKVATAPKADSLLVELLTEELPPKSLRHLAEAFADAVVSGLARYQLKSREADARAFSTPRRLGVLVPGVFAQAQDRSNEVNGPPVSATPEAVAGFARKHGLSVEALAQQDTPKGRVFVARTTIR